MNDARSGPALALAVTVVGLGAMGRGIARLFAQAGAEVTVIDVDERATASGHARLVEEAAADGSAVDVRVAASVADATAGADLLIEAVLEDPGVKDALLHHIGELAGPDLVVATNTSSLSVDGLARSYGRPEQFIGLHFFNPPTRMRLVELVRGTFSDEKVVAAATQWVRAIGREPVICVDSPNFVVNRVCRPLYHEAALLVSSGIPPATVDAAVRRALGHPLGPLELLDRIGLHTHLASSESAARELGDPRYQPVPLVRRLVRAGADGQAAGHGFYDWTSRPRDQQAGVVRTPGRDPGRGVTVVGPGGARCEALARAGGSPITVYSCGPSVVDDDVRAVRGLLADGADVVVDSADGAWLGRLPAGADWIRLHPAAASGWFAEVVTDDLAGIAPGASGFDLLDAVGAPAVEVPAAAGLVVERLHDCLVNEASVVVQEGVASAVDVDVALRLGMNHPRGPFESLRLVGAATVSARLRAMAAVTGDPRYRPAAYLQRLAHRECIDAVMAVDETGR